MSGAQSVLMQEYVSKLNSKKNLPRYLNMDNVSPATRLLEKRRQMFEVQEALEAQKEEFARREELFKRREEALKKKDLELQESLIKFSKFLQENDAKRQRAEKKAADEVALRVKREGEIAKLRAELEKLKKDKQTSYTMLGKGMNYQKFLESVLEVTEEYPEINDLLMRYATLEATNRDLVDKAAKSAMEMENHRKMLSDFVKEKMNEILGYNNDIAALQKELERRTLEAQNLQAKLDQDVQEHAKKTTELGQIRMACENIFQRVFSRKGPNSRMPPLEGSTEERILGQLKHIGEKMDDYWSIVKGASKESHKGAAAAASASAGVPAAAVGGGTVGGGASQRNAEPATRAGPGAYYGGSNSVVAR
eukprot:tig00021122_g18443.t1